MKHSQLRHKNAAHLQGQIIQSKRNLEREQNILQTPVADLLGKGEGEIVQRLLEMKGKMSSVEWTEMAILMQKLLRGPASLLMNEGNPEVDAELAKLRAKAVAEDKAMEAWNKDSQRFIEQTVEQSEKLIPNKATKERLVAKGVAMYEEAKNGAVASQVNKRLMVTEMLQNGPKEEINVIGEIETIMVNGQPQARIAPVIISLGQGITYSLKPGTQTVPKIIADRYHQIERSRDEFTARSKALSENLEQTDLNKRLNQINKTFDAKTDAFPLA